MCRCIQARRVFTAREDILNRISVEESGNGIAALQTRGSSLIFRLAPKTISRCRDIMGSILNAMFPHPYWKERVYGYETPQGTIVVSVEEGFKIEKSRLLGLEEKIKEYLSQWANEQ